MSLKCTIFCVTQIQITCVGKNNKGGLEKIQDVTVAMRKLTAQQIKITCSMLMY